MKRRTYYLFACLLLGSGLLCSCHKVCTCIDYGQRVHEYTAEEVDAHAAGNCSEMTEFPYANHYSYCHW